MSCPPYDYPRHPLCNIELWELTDSREHRTTGRTSRGIGINEWILQFAVRGTNSEVEVEARVDHVQLGIPVYFHQQPLNNRQISKIGEGLWRVEAVYSYTGITSRVSPLPASISHSTLGGSQTLMRAIARPFRTEGAPDEKLYLGWDGKGKVEGITHPASQVTRRETWRMTRRELFGRPGFVWLANGIPSDLWGSDSEEDYWGLKRLALIDRYDKMVGWVHGYDWDLLDYAAKGTAGTFRSYSEGEILFRGAQIEQVDDSQFDVSLEFEIVKNDWVDIPPTADGAKNVKVTNGPPKIREHPQIMDRFQIWKNGWDEFDASYVLIDEDPGDGQGEAIIPQPNHFRILQKARYCPFNFLGVSVSNSYDGATDQNRQPLPSALTPAGEYPPGWDRSICTS